MRIYRNMKKQKYEYRVIMAEKGTSVITFEDEMNKYAAYGWEYVGPIENGSLSPNSNYIHLVFKREV